MTIKEKDMKLATLKKQGSRDGRLVVVSRDLSRAVPVEGIAPTLQYALENWASVSPHLRLIYEDLNTIEEIGDLIRFDAKDCAAPLPRAYQWLDGSAYVNHVELVRKSRGVEMPESFWTDPLMYQGGSDAFLGARDDVPLPDVKHGIDFEGEIAVITDDVPMGVTPEKAAQHIKLVMLVNDWSLRYLAMSEIAKGFGFMQSKPATAFSPVAVAPESLGQHWREGRLHLPLVSEYNGVEFGRPNAGVDMVFDFPTLVAHAARTRFLSAGTIIGSGTVSNKDRSVGSSCIVERRTLEKLDKGESTTPFMQFGDRVKIDMVDELGLSIFGAIDQIVVPYAAS